MAVDKIDDSHHDNLLKEKAKQGKSSFASIPFRYLLSFVAETLILIILISILTLHLYLLLYTLRVRSWIPKRYKKVKNQ